MTIGQCARCGRIGRVESDHPDGRHRGVPLFPDVTVPLCPPCHLTKGRMDRAAGVEGDPITVQRVLRRRVAWCVFLSTGGDVLLIPSFVLADLGHVLAVLAQAVPDDLPLRVRP
jgi:hypothetical protein